MTLIMLGISTSPKFFSSDAQFIYVTNVNSHILIQSFLPGNMFPVARFSIIFTTLVLSGVVVVVFAALLAGRDLVANVKSITIVN